MRDEYVNLETYKIFVPKNITFPVKCNNSSLYFLYIHIVKSLKYLKSIRFVR